MATVICLCMSASAYALSIPRPESAFGNGFTIVNSTEIVDYGQGQFVDRKPFDWIIVEERRERHAIEHPHKQKAVFANVPAGSPVLAKEVGVQIVTPPAAQVATAPIALESSDRGPLDALRPGELPSGQDLLDVASAESQPQVVSVARELTVAPPVIKEGGAYDAASPISWDVDPNDQFAGVRAQVRELRDLLREGPQDLLESSAGLDRQGFKHAQGDLAAAHVGALGTRVPMKGGRHLSSGTELMCPKEGPPP